MIDYNGHERCRTLVQKVKPWLSARLDGDMVALHQMNMFTECRFPRLSPFRAWLDRELNFQIGPLANGYYSLLHNPQVLTGFEITQYRMLESCTGFHMLPDDLA